MYFRWADDNNQASSPDQMIAIDNVSVTAYTPVGPVVSITSPSSGASFVAGSIVNLQSSASDVGGTVTNVTYYSSASPIVSATAATYAVGWSNLQAGSYSLTARAMDDQGLMATSSVVSVSVTNSVIASFTGAYSQNFDSDLTNSSTLMPAGFQAMGLPGDHF